MSKKIFSIALFGFVAVGCSATQGDAAQGDYDAAHINFTTQISKALGVGVAEMEGDAAGFVVFGAMAGGSEWYDRLDGSSYLFDSASQQWGWGSATSPSWPEPFAAMNIYAYYPAAAAGFVPTTLAPATISADIEVEPSILDQVDFLAARSGDIVAKPFTGMQPLGFDHIMSKVNFNMVQDAGVLVVIRQLGLENVITKGCYDYIGAQWEPLDNAQIGSFSDYVGSSGVYSKYGVAGKVDRLRYDKHSLMMIPQSGGSGAGKTPVWDGSVTLDHSGELLPEGAYISIRYRTNDAVGDIVGYAHRTTTSIETQWSAAENSAYYAAYKVGGSYRGPLYVKAGFRFSSSELQWVSGKEYDYILPLNKNGGIYLSPYYYDISGVNTKIRVAGSPEVGDPLFDTDIAVVGLTIKPWGHSQTEI